MMMLLALLTLTSVPPQPQTKEPPPIVAPQKRVALEGVYVVVGTQNGVKYNGVCVIRELQKDSFHVVNVTGKVIVQGVGIKTGDNFAVSWSDGRLHGVSVYRITGRTLTGRWTQDGHISREEMNFLGDLPED
jgi:hypothetical protein